MVDTRPGSCSDRTCFGCSRARCDQRRWPGRGIAVPGSDTDTRRVRGSPFGTAYRRGCSCFANSARTRTSVSARFSVFAVVDVWVVAGDVVGQLPLHLGEHGVEVTSVDFAAELDD